MEFEELAVLGGPNDPVAIRDDAASRDCMVTRTVEGGYLVSGLIGGGTLAHFREDGTFDRTFGRRGRGPGELGADLRVAVGAGDSIIVMDNSQGRASVFDGGGNFFRSFSIPPVSRTWTRRADGSFAFVEDPAVPGRALVTILGADGSRLGTVDRPSNRLGPVAMDSWVLSASASGGLWLASIWNYEIFRISGNGDVDLILQRDADWFPEGGQYEVGMPTTVQPSPLIRFIREWRPGILMVVAVVPDQDWEPNVAPRPSFAWARGVFDTRVEIVDIEGARMIASSSTDEWLGAVCNSTLMYTVSEGADLTLQLRIVRPIF